jgi:hypothetical protein
MLRSLYRRRAVLALLLLFSAVGFLAATARVFSLPVLPLVVGLLCGVAIALLADRYRQRARTRARSQRPRVLPGGRVLGRHYDLRRDRSTDDQRWLM